MQRPDLIRICPECGAPTARKIRRAFWMRLLAGSVRLSCSACGAMTFLRAAGTGAVSLTVRPDTALDYLDNCLVKDVPI